MKSMRDMRPAELSRRSGVSKQNVSRILRDTHHSVTGAPPRTEQETIEKIADALNWPQADALRLLGIQPKEELSPTEAERRVIENLLFRRRRISPKRRRDFDNFMKMLDNQIDVWEMEDNNGG
jgi:transcriptional regulator with XRE-family HTH domain